MHPRKRWISFLALATVVALSVACGGQAAEPPAEETPAPEETAPAPEVAPEPEPMPVEPVEPAAPQITGNIVEIELSEEQMVWTTAATREVPGKYYWIVKLRNDTTSTLDITVTFDFLDENDEIVKTDRKTERLQPAEEGTFRVEGEMNRDQSRAVLGYSYAWDWEPVEGS